MKKIFVYRFTGIILACIVTSIVYGQISNGLQKFRKGPLPENIIPLSKELNLTTDSDFNFRNEISTNAVRSFIRDYKNVPNAKWSKSANGLFVVYFTSDSINNSIYYNKRGEVEFMLLYYKEEKLPSYIRHRIKSNYYDFNIYHVTEIRHNSKTTWYVTIEDKTRWKKIKVEDTEMEVVEAYSKG